MQESSIVHLWRICQEVCRAGCQYTVCLLYTSLTVCPFSSFSPSRAVGVCAQRLWLEGISQLIRQAFNFLTLLEVSEFHNDAAWTTARNSSTVDLLELDRLYLCIHFKNDLHSCAVFSSVSFVTSIPQCSRLEISLSCSIFGIEHVLDDSSASY